MRRARLLRGFDETVDVRITLAACGTHDRRTAVFPRGRPRTGGIGIAPSSTRACGGPALGWVHLVALGWLTMIALSVLVHVIPAFTDVVWRWETLARRSLTVYAVGVVVLVAGFCTGARGILSWGGTIVALGLLGYAVPAAVTLVSAFRLGRVEAAIARALGATLTFLLLAAALGVAFTWALDGRLPATILVTGAPIHAELGLIGWLTVLIMGVSARTVGPIAGARSAQAWRHVTAGSAEIVGMVAAGAGFAIRLPTVLWIGTVVLGIGVAVYVIDLSSILRRATVSHRPPQAFMAWAALWLLLAFVLGVGTLRGSPWGPAFVYVVLMGWLGQMVNAHLHHIGIRLLSTAFRGDDDETRPGELLSVTLSWTTFVLFQAAVLAGVAALLLDHWTLHTAAAAAGLLGWVAMTANALYAARRASQPTPVISLLGIR